MTVIVTGGASGIGSAVAARLAARAHVTIADCDFDRARMVAKNLCDRGSRAVAFHVDVTERASVFRLIDSVLQLGEPIEGLFANAGINIRAPFDEIEEADWNAMQSTHLRGCFLSAQAVLPHMIARKAGAVVTSASDFAVMGVANLASYCAAKTAIYSLTRSLALEFASEGVRVNAVGPGPIDTPLLRSSKESFEAIEARNAKALPIGRIGRPEEVAVVVDFLLSDRASNITGQMLHPNGGQLMY